LPWSFDESTILSNKTDIGTLPKELLQRLRLENTEQSHTEVVSPLITYTIFLGSAAKSFTTETTLGWVVNTIPGPLAHATNVSTISVTKTED
jgi:hypothetical protein